MTLRQRCTTKRHALAFLLLAAFACSNDSTSPPTLHTISVALSASTIVAGQPDTATAAGFDQTGGTVSLGTVVWSSSDPSVATVDDSGIVTGVAAGTTNIVATVGNEAGQQRVTVTASPGIKVNEVESSGGTPGDWAEFYNPMTASVDISGWVMKDNDDSHIYTFPAGSVISSHGFIIAEEADMGFGLGSSDAVRLFNQYGALVDSYTWTSHAATTYGRCPDGTGDFTTTTSSTKGTANDCSVAVKINEVESSGGTPGDWIELYNAGPSTIDLSGYVLKDNDDTHIYTFPSGTSIAAATYLVVDESDLGFGLGSSDAARLFDPSGTLIDSYTWTSHATTTYGRCPDGTGDFTTTVSSTKGTANDCGGLTATAWPGSGTDVQTVDGSAVFGGNLSGLTYQVASGGNPATLWAVRNGPSTLYELVWNGSIWTPATTNSWDAGKSLHYTDGTGDPDSEGLTYADGNGAVYVSTERNNDASSVSRPAVLRFDISQSSSSLTATNDWNLTSDLPAVGANLGLEAITWIPDSYLTSKHFYDEHAGHAYTPGDYANHGTGLFFVGLEANGMVYAYALDHTTNGFTRVATISTGNTAIMGLEYDRDFGYLWATCDDGCGGKSTILEIDTTTSSSTYGHFIPTRQFDRPSSMPNLNNEGFAIQPESECVSGNKYVFWSDDSETDGHAIRRATIACGALP